VFALLVQWHSTAQTLEVTCTTLHYCTLQYSTLHGNCLYPGVLCDSVYAHRGVRREFALSRVGA
jgi:hypothetical protein